MEILESLVSRILTLVEEEIKKILWTLCYNPKKVLEAYGVCEEEIDVEDLQNAIIKVCRTKYQNFVFASEEQKLNSYGIEIKTKNPIIRDTIIEHCMETAQNSIFLHICISNICTKRASLEYYINRREGFSLLDFSEEEQAFLEKELDTYCIGELLKAIQREKYPNTVPKKKREIEKEASSSTPAVMQPRTYVRSDMSRNTGEDSDSKLDLTKLVENKNDVESFLVYYNGTECVNPVLLLENLDKVAPLVEKAQELKEKGIDPRSIGQKAKDVERFYTSLDCL